MHKAAFPGRVGASQAHPARTLALAHVVRGATSNEAARNLGLSPRTIEYYRASIIRKLDAKNTADLVRKVLDHDGAKRRS